MNNLSSESVMSIGVRVREWEKKEFDSLEDANIWYLEHKDDMDKEIYILETTKLPFFQDNKSCFIFIHEV